MALDRQDVRFKLDPNEHDALKEISGFDGCGVGEWVEHLVLQELHRRAEEAARATSLHERLKRLGISGNNRESSGMTGSAGSALERRTNGTDAAR